jgi:hypothetical protein
MEQIKILRRFFTFSRRTLLTDEKLFAETLFVLAQELAQRPLPSLPIHFTEDGVVRATYENHY